MLLFRGMLLDNIRSIRADTLEKGVPNNFQCIPNWGHFSSDREACPRRQRTMYRMSTTMVATTAWIICLAFVCSPVSAFVGARFGGSLQVGRWTYAQASTGSQLSMVATKRVENVAAVLLAGGVGKRMGTDRPKQFLELQGMPVLEHSLKLFGSLKGISQLIVVMDEQYRETLSDFQQREPRLVFADPGKERQDSVYNGLQKVDADASLVCIHDVARPLVTKECIYRVIADADEHGAAVLGVVMKATVKESEDGEFVLRTIDRSRLWEIQTPQVVKPDILRKGFETGKENGWEVTDDVSIVEHLGLPVKLTKGEYTNLKLTTPEDLVVASQILETRRLEQADTLEVDEDDDAAAGEERLSKTRANAKWAKNPRKVGASEKEEVVSFSERRANVKWTDKPRGVAPPKEGEVDVKMDLSKIRAEA